MGKWPCFNSQALGSVLNMSNMGRFLELRGGPHGHGKNIFVKSWSLEPHSLFARSKLPGTQ